MRLACSDIRSAIENFGVYAKIMFEISKRVFVIVVILVASITVVFILSVYTTRKPVKVRLKPWLIYDLDYRR